jgi:hypothetical protein
VNVESTDYLSKNFHLDTSINSIDGLSSARRAFSMGFGCGFSVVATFCLTADAFMRPQSAVARAII